jgi:DNA polymerase V
MPLILHGEDMAMSNNTSDNSDDDSQQFDFQQHFIQHEEATLCTFARDDSLQNRGVCSGDLLIVNRKLRPQHNDIVLAALYGDLTCKILDLTNNTIHSGSDDETPTPIADLDELHIIGVVTHSSTKHRG